MKTNKNTRKFKFAIIAILMISGFSSFATGTLGSHKAIKPVSKKTTSIVKKHKVAATTYTFTASSDRQNYTQFAVSVNGVQIGDLYQISSNNPTVTITDTNPVSSGATVQVQIYNGTIPASSWLIGPFSVQGRIAGNVITFSNVPLSTGGSCNMLFNSN